MLLLHENEIKTRGKKINTKTKTPGSPSTSESIVCIFPPSRFEAPTPSLPGTPPPPPRRTPPRAGVQRKHNHPPTAGQHRAGPPGATKRGLGPSRRAGLGPPAAGEPRGGQPAAGRARGDAGGGRRRRPGWTRGPPPTITPRSVPGRGGGSPGSRAREAGARRAPLPANNRGQAPAPERRQGAGRESRAQRPTAARLRGGLAPLRPPSPPIWPHRRLRGGARRAGGPVRCRYSRAER